MDIHKGSRVTRIDTIVGNRVAAHAVNGLCYQWHLSQGMDHVGLTITTDQQAYNEKVTKNEPPERMNLPNTHPQHRKRNEQAKRDIEERFNRIWEAE